MRCIVILLVGSAVCLGPACNSRPAAEPTKPDTQPGMSARRATDTQPESRSQPAAVQPPTAIALFNGQDLSGWTYELDNPNVRMDEVWSVEDGVLVCRGKPAGYLRTENQYQDYVLTLEWRWPPETRGGNNGVLVHASTPRALGIWPKSIEVQLQAGHAGDLWIIGTQLDVEDEENRRRGRRHLNLTDDSEKPLGQWNQIEITCKGDEVTVKVNGDLVNHATHCSVTRGAICLQSEGAPIHYRNLRLTPLKREEGSG